jgi:quinol-cytochrome oxidoreductase complex cytochrome b subunit
MSKKVWQNTWVLLLAIATVGPLAIPLVWKNPDYSKTKKWAWTIFIALLTLFLIWFMVWGMKAYMEWLQSKMVEMQQLNAQ